MRKLRKLLSYAIKGFVLYFIGCSIYHLYWLITFKSAIINKLPTLEPMNIPKLNVLEKSLKFSKPLFFQGDPRFKKRDMLDENHNPFRIVIWNLKDNSQHLANPEVCLSNISCIINGDYENASTAHAVVFKAGSLSPDVLPKKRHEDQLYAWWATESSKYSYRPPDALDGIFNITFHYRLDADVYSPYGSINLILRELYKAGETDLENLLEKKRNSDKMVAWAVSNCYKKRLDYGKNLMSLGLKVNGFGRCFGGREIGDGKYSASFYKELSNYKFYFAFENCISCKDYITEKFWFNGLFSGAVPVVWGPLKEDILKVAPTKSFIHTDDFTPVELVKYLNYLASNETAYAEYLQWRTWVTHPERTEQRLTMQNRDYDLRSFCKLCSILQIDAKRKRLKFSKVKHIHTSFNEEWLGRDLDCHF